MAAMDQYSRGVKRGTITAFTRLLRNEQDGAVRSAILHALAQDMFPRQNYLNTLQLVAEFFARVAADADAHYRTELERALPSAVAAHQSGRRA